MIWTQSLKGEDNKGGIVRYAYNDTYTKAQVDDLLSNGDWKKSVENFAEIEITYPNPQIGWVVSVNSDQVIYRYNGVEWVGLFGNSDVLEQSKVYTNTEIEKLVGSAPESLDTLEELSVAIGNDANFASTIQEKIEELKTQTENAINKTDKIYQNNVYVSDTGTAFGDNTTAVGNSSYAEGYGTLAYGPQSHVEGLNNTSAGIASHAEGYATVAIADYTHAEGKQTTASGEASHAEGYMTLSSGLYSHAEGSETLAVSACSHAEGNATVAKGAALFKVVSVNADTRQVTVSAGFPDYPPAGVTTVDLLTNAMVLIKDVPFTSTGQVLTLGTTPVFNDMTIIISYVLLSNTSVGMHAEGLRATATGSYSHAEGINTIASGTAAHAEGYTTVAMGTGSHSEGYNTIASGTYSHSEGYNTAASGMGSHAEGLGTIASGGYSHAEGGGTSATGNYSHAEGGFTLASGMYSHAANLNTNANTYASTAIGRYNKALAGATNSAAVADDLFVIGSGTSTSALSNALRVTAGGAVYGRAAYNSTGADYAEYFEWLDDNPNHEDRVGSVVTLEGDRIRLATKDDTYVLGIISAEPSVVGDSYQDDWNGRYETDEWGRLIEEEFEYEEEVHIHEEPEPPTPEEMEDPEFVHPEPISRIETVIRKGTRFKENTEWIPEKDYLPRSARPEWSAVGIMGKLRVSDDGTCQVNGFARVGDTPGTLTASNEPTNMRVIARISPTIVKIFIK